MPCWPAATSRWGTTRPAPTSPAGSRIASTRKPASVSSDYAEGNQPDHAVLSTPGTANRRNKKEGRMRGPLFCWLELAARKTGTEAVERRRRRVVVGHIGAVAETVPDSGAVDDAAGADLADDHDPMPGRQDAQRAIAGAGTGALPDGVGCEVRVPGCWGRRGRRWHQARPYRRRRDEVDVAMRPDRALSIPQVVGPVVFLNDRVAGGVDRHYVRDMAAPPGTVLPAVPDGHGTDSRMAVDDIADRCRRRIPRSAVAEEGGLSIRALQRRAVQANPFLAQPERGERRAVPGVEAPGIQFVDRPAVGIVIDPGGADRQRRDSEQEHGRSHHRRQRLAHAEPIAIHRADATSPSRALRGICLPVRCRYNGGSAPMASRDPRSLLIGRSAVGGRHRLTKRSCHWLATCPIFG